MLKPINLRRVALWCALGLLVDMGVGPAAALAQTIADYSKAQRQVMEAEMARNVQRALLAGGAGEASSASASGPTGLPTMAGGPAGQGSTVPSSPGAAPPLPGASLRPRALMSKVSPAAHGLQVNGVFISASSALAQVQVGALPYLLRAGQSVPGTHWLVQQVQSDQVVLVSTTSSRTKRVFKLPTT